LFLLPYNLLWMIGLPAALVRLFWRGRKQPAYLHHLRERLGCYAAVVPKRVIWVHAVSLGETRAAEPLVRALLERWPAHTIVLTHMTPTGREASENFFSGNSRVLRCWLPYDFIPFVECFLRHFRPEFGVVMETELWPTLLDACHRRNIPVLLANARLSERSARRYARLPALARLAFGLLSAAGAQSADDAARLKALGTRQVYVTGNIKFDMVPPPDALALGERFRAFLGKRPVIFAASTREGEEVLILDVFRRALSRNPQAVLVLAPRHPQRFDEVETLIRAHGFVMARRSKGTDSVLPPETRVWLGDSMGEMFAYYAASNVALIGGSWLPFGGQNPIEASAVGIPVLIGPHTFNFHQVTADAVKAGAARRFNDVEAALGAAFDLLEDTAARTAMSSAGIAFATAHRGATARTIELLAGISTNTTA
jgi:3-deoxy-D-manno-octulosonic-acid transferase